MKKWIIFALVLAIYGVSVWGGFIQDDTKVIVGDPEMGKASALVATFTRPYYYMDGGNAGVYRPITSFSLYLNALITGKDAWGFHLVNVILYALLCVLLFEVLKKYCSEKVAFCGALIFAVLPVHTEAVNNIVGRAEILSLGFLLVAILLQYRKRWEVSAGIFLLALLSKETAIVGLPILIYLLFVTKEKKDVKAGVSLFYVLVTTCYFVLRIMVLGGGGMENNATIVENPLKFVSTEVRVENAFALVPLGISKVVFPWHLSYDYSFNQLKLVSDRFDWRFLIGVFLMILSIGSLFTGLREKKMWILGQALFWGPLVVTGNFLFPVGTIFGERLWFWPSLGMVLMSITLLYLFEVHKSRTPAQLSLPPLAGSHVHGPCGFVGTSAQIFGVLFPLIIVVFVGRTFTRNLDWQSQDSLFIHDATYASGSVMVQNNAAAMYLIRKDFVMAKVYLDKAETIYPKYPELMNNWGMYYLLTGDKKTAEEKFDECLQEHLGNGLCKSNLELVK